MFAVSNLGDSKQSGGLLDGSKMDELDFGVRIDGIQSLCKVSLVPPAVRYYVVITEPVVSLQCTVCKSAHREGSFCEFTAHQ